MSWGQILTAVEPNGLELGRWGRLEIPNHEHLRVRNAAGKVRDIDAQGLLRSGTDISGWFEAERGFAILGGRGTEVLRIDLTADEAMVVTQLDREPDEDLRFLSFHEAGDVLLCLYERGVVCFDLDGQLRWQAQHRDLSAKFDGVRDGVAWFSSQWPQDRIGHRLAFRLFDGQQVMG